MAGGSICERLETGGRALSGFERYCAVLCCAVLYMEWLVLSCFVVFGARTEPFFHEVYAISVSGLCCSSTES